MSKVCGTGGVSCGAVMAGLQLQYSLDKAAHVRETWEYNLPEGTFIHNTARQFLRVNDTRKELKVDVLHLSPPCQTFSVAHTTVGRNDAQNEAPMRLIARLIQKATPRIVTLEQSDAFLNSRNVDLLGATLYSFTKLGFSIKYKYMAFEKYGLPQSRHRLVIIAAW